MRPRESDEDEMFARNVKDWLERHSYANREYIAMKVQMAMGKYFIALTFLNLIK